MISGNRNSMTIQQERARSEVHPCYVQGAALAGDGAVWPLGLILARLANGKAAPYGEVSVNIGVGATPNKVFGALLGPIEPGTVAVTDGVESFADDGFGVLTGDGAAPAGAGKVNYQTGKVSVSFKAAPANAAVVSCVYKPEPCLVLDEATDTIESDTSGLVIVHGGVQTRLLKVGPIAQSAPSAAVLATLQRSGVFAV